MRQVARFWNVRMALVASLVLILQAMSSGLATGSMAAVIGVDVFGNPICITSADHVGDATGQGDNHHLGSECCTMGCGASVSLAPPPPVGAVAIRLALHDDRPARPDIVVPTRQPDHDPASPRAPPRLA